MKGEVALYPQPRAILSELTKDEALRCIEKLLDDKIFEDDITVGIDTKYNADTHQHDWIGTYNIRSWVFMSSTTGSNEEEKFNNAKKTAEARLEKMIEYLEE